MGSTVSTQSSPTSTPIPPKKQPIKREESSFGFDAVREKMNDVSPFGKVFPSGSSRRRKLHRNVHRLKLANNKTKRVRGGKHRTFKLRR